MTPIMPQAQLDQLAAVHESAMNDRCTILSAPDQPSTPDDWSGTATTSDGAWTAIVDPASDPPSTDIPCLIGLRPTLRPDQVEAGAQIIDYTYVAGVPVRMRGLVKQHDHVVWRGTHYAVVQVGDGTFATAIRLMLVEAH